MRPARRWLSRVAGLFTAQRGDREFADELASHLEIHIDDNVRAGMTPEAAKRDALLKLGGIDQVRERQRDERRLPLVDTLIRDCSYGVRSIRKNPGFSAAAMLILGLGIGANTAIFSVVNAVLLRPLTFRDSSRIMRVWHTPPGNLFTQPAFAVSPANYVDWQARNHVFERMAIYKSRRMNLTAWGEPDGLQTARVSEQFFSVLGVTTLAGRTIGPGDVDPGQPNVVVLAEILRRIRALPGVEAAAATDSLPLRDLSTIPVAIEGRPAPPLSEQPTVAFQAVTPGYLDAARIKLVGGRDFTGADTVNHPVVLVSQSMAAKFWPNENPVGRHLVLGLLSSDLREVVGVVGDVKLHGLEARESVMAVYLPVAQYPFDGLSLLVRTATRSNTVALAIVRAVHEIEPDQSVLDVLTMDDVIGQTLETQRFAMRLLATFASLALVLAAVGIYSVLSYGVSQRAREVGIRMAIGASQAGVLRMVIAEGLRQTAMGLATGLLGAVAIGRVLSTLVFGVSVSVHDAATFVSVSLVLIVVGVIAAAGPAYRAASVDPLLAIRNE